MKEEKTMIKSTTAVRHGSGSDPFRWVSFLTAKEREIVRKGGKVYFKSSKRNYLQSGFKIVTYYAGKYGFREPSDSELKEIKKKEGKK